MPWDLKRDLTRAAKLLDEGRLDEAGPLLNGLIAAFPMHPYVLYNTGLWHWRSKNYQAGIAYYRKALGADPNLVQAQVNLGCSLMETGDLRESVRYFQMALRRLPNDPMVLVNLAQALVGLGEAIDALAALDDALKVDPNHLPALRQRMGALSELNRFRPALDAALKVLAHPDGSTAVDALNMVVSMAAKFSDWEMVERYRPRLLEVAGSTAIPVSAMALAFHCDDPAFLGRIAVSRCPDPAMPPRPCRPAAAERITVAYMSPDLREHPVAHMMLDVLRAHDKRAYRIVTVGTLPEDPSPLGREIAALTEGHIDLTRLDDSQAVQELRRQGVDVLVDLAGATKWCRPGVLARRPCPVQVLWLGCPCTTGAPYYDAYIVDAVVAPPGYERHCTEPLLRLPCCYHPISTGFGDVRSDATRAHFNLPEGPVIVGILQQPAKVGPPFVDLIAPVIGRHPDAHLWIRVHDDGVGAAQQRFLAHGLPLERQHFAKLYRDRRDYLAIHTLVDLIVDSHPYGGHSTTGEAIIQGTPVLTVRGRSIHARVAASMLHELGLDELVFDDFPALQAGLDRLLGDPSHLAGVRQRCRAAAEAYRRDGPRRLTMALEGAYRDLLQQAPPRSA